MSVRRIQAYKYELMPSGEQQHNMRRFAGSCRFVFNKALALETANHAAGNKFIRYVEMANMLPLWKNEFAWLRESPSQALQHADQRTTRRFLSRPIHKHCPMRARIAARRPNRSPIGVSTIE